MVTALMPARISQINFLKNVKSIFCNKNHTNQHIQKRQKNFMLKRFEGKVIQTLHVNNSVNNQQNQHADFFIF